MSVIDEDVHYILSRVCWEMFQGKRILVTGGTGLIGKTLVRVLIAAGIQTVLIVRSESKARDLYADACEYVVGTVEQLPAVDGPVDYIIHMASPTASTYFVEHPVGTINAAVEGTRNLLELAKEKHTSGFVYLSSMEVYGYPSKGHAVTEEEIAGFDTRLPRNSYPISKEMCEMLCVAYAKECAVPACILRLTQTFGPGVEYQDTRIFAEFMRCAVERKNIVLHTQGLTERCYLYTADAVTAILTALSYGNAGEVYNVANPDTYCSIREMAQLVAEMGEIAVEYRIDGIQRGYADTLYMNLNVDRMVALGWQPGTGLKEMFERMILSCRV